MESTKLIKNKVYNFYLSYKNILLMPSYFIQSIPLTCENVRELIFSSNWSTEEGRKSTKVQAEHNKKKREGKSNTLSTNILIKEIIGTTKGLIKIIAKFVDLLKDTALSIIMLQAVGGFESIWNFKTNFASIIVITMFSSILPSSSIWYYWIKI